MTALRVTSIGDALPQGYSAVSVTSDSKRPAWRRRQICCMLTNDMTVLSKEPLLTDIIVCSRMKKAPPGFQYAGEINGMLICYKTGTRSNDTFQAEKFPDSERLSTSENGGDLNYENVNNTPDQKKRLPPARPPKEGSIVAELNKLNLQNNSKSPDDKVNFVSNHDYEVLNRSYGFQPTRSAPPIPGAPPVPPRGNVKPQLEPTYSSYTLGSYNTLEGVKFMLNPKLSGFSNNQKLLPVIKRRTLLELNREYAYNFIAERQT